MDVTSLSQPVQSTPQEWTKKIKSFTGCFIGKQRLNRQFQGENMFKFRLFFTILVLFASVVVNFFTVIILETCPVVDE